MLLFGLPDNVDVQSWPGMNKMIKIVNVTILREGDHKYQGSFIGLELNHSASNSNRYLCGLMFSLFVNWLYS